MYLFACDTFTDLLHTLNDHSFLYRAIYRHIRVFQAFFCQYETYLPIELFIPSFLGCNHHQNQNPTASETVLPYDHQEHSLGRRYSVFHLP